MKGGTHPTPETEEITIRESDGYFVARDESTRVSSQGETKVEALQNLADALELYEEPVAEEEDAHEAASAPWF
jgi:predicted RNase H-like HicB family nuclease